MQVKVQLLFLCLKTTGRAEVTKKKINLYRTAAGLPDTNTSTFHLLYDEQSF